MGIGEIANVFSHLGGAADWLFRPSGWSQSLASRRSQEWESMMHPRDREATFQLGHPTFVTCIAKTDRTRPYRHICPK